MNNFNDKPYYFKNGFPTAHYAAFRWRVARSNRDAIGAVVRLSLGERSLVRQVDGSGGYRSQSSKTLHFGLGDRGRIDRVEIQWPSGQRQVMQVVSMHAALMDGANRASCFFNRSSL